jgi:GNAT superfamily N-acetyltransferase
MSLTQLRFRLADASDSARVAELHAASWRANYRGALSDSYLDGDILSERAEAWAQRLAEPSARQWVQLAAVRDELMGFACVLLVEEPACGACLDNLHVRPGLTGQGIGSQLLTQARQWVARVEPTWPMHLWVLEANAAARRFYERHGGEAVERAAKRLPDGSAPLVWRYLWRQPATLRPVRKAAE